MSKKPILFLVAAVMCTIAAIPLTGCTERRDEGNGAAEYTVNFDLSCTVDGQEVWSTVNGEREAESVTITEGSAFLNKLPALDERTDDYVFLNWYYYFDNGNIEVTESTVFDTAVFKEIKDGSLTLVAVCRPREKLTVKFNLFCEVGGEEVWSTVNGQTTVDDAEIMEGERFGTIFPELDKRNDRYIFVYWCFFDKDGRIIGITETYVFDIADFEDLTLENNTLTLYAFCSVDIYTLEFDLSCETDGQIVQSFVGGKKEVPSVSIFAGILLGELLPELDAREDEYIFVGWYYITDTVQIKVDKDTVFNKELFTGLENKTVVLQAMCEKNTEVKVNFDLVCTTGGGWQQFTVNGADTVPYITISEGDTFWSLLPEPDEVVVEADYLFNYWYCEVYGEKIKVDDDTIFRKGSFTELGVYEIILKIEGIKQWIGPY